MGPRPGARSAHFAQVTLNGALYSVFSRAALRDVPFREVLGGDWVLIGAMAARGRLETLGPSTSRARSSGISTDAQALAAREFGLTWSLSGDAPHVAVAWIVFSPRRSRRARICRAPERAARGRGALAGPPVAARAPASPLRAGAWSEPASRSRASLSIAPLEPRHRPRPRSEISQPAGSVKSARRRRQVRHDEVGVQLARRIDEDRLRPDAAAASMSEGLSPITARLQHDRRNCSRGLLEHRRPGLAAVARPGLMRAVVDQRRCARPPPALSAQAGVDGARRPSSSCARARFRAGLSRRRRACRQSPSEREALERARQQAERAQAADVVALGRLAVDDAVAVEEDRGQVMPRSTRSHRTWTMSMCASWMRGVEVEGTHDEHVDARPSKPPPAPVNPTVARPRSRAARHAGQHVRRRPARRDRDGDVAGARRSASTWRANTFSKP